MYVVEDDLRIRSSETERGEEQEISKTPTIRKLRVLDLLPLSLIHWRHIGSRDRWNFDISSCERMVGYFYFKSKGSGIKGEETNFARVGGGRMPMTNKRTERAGPHEC